MCRSYAVAVMVELQGSSGAVVPSTTVDLDRSSPATCRSLSTFAVFSVLVLKEKLRWPDLISFSLIFAGKLASSGVVAHVFSKHRLELAGETRSPLPLTAALALLPCCTGVAVSLAKPGSKGQEAPAPEVALGPMPVAPAPEAAIAPAPAPAAQQGGGGRRLLQLIGIRKQPEQQGPSPLEKASSAPSAGSSAGEQLGEDGQMHASQPQQAQQASPYSSLGEESSTAVLIASGVDVYATSSQQGVHSRGHSQQQEVPPEVEQPAAAQR